MARRKANDLENQMSLMDMMASESPEYTEEGPEELLDPSEDTGNSEGQTDKPFKLVANKTTKAKASISTQALSVVKAVYADTVETNWEELFDGFDRLYAITFSSGIEFVNKVINEKEPCGDVPKWLKGSDSKSDRRRKACGGSNPSISARKGTAFVHRTKAVSF